MTRSIVILCAIVVAVALSASHAAEPQCCVRADIVLRGDGKHDDSAALNAWFRGEHAIWAESGEPVGAAIAGRSFRLSDAVYVPGGTGRRLEDFRMLWPERGETVSGGRILAGTDAQQAPTLSGVSIIGGDSGEGVPFEAPDPTPGAEANCATS